jgi:hypothetical protein
VPGANKFALLLSACLNITRENVELKRMHDEFLGNISKRSNNLIRTIDESVQ